MIAMTDRSSSSLECKCPTEVGSKSNSLYFYLINIIKSDKDLKLFGENFMALFGSDFDGISVNFGEGASGFNILINVAKHLFRTLE